MFFLRACYYSGMRSIHLLHHIRASEVLEEKQMTVYARAESNDAGKVTKTLEEKDLACFCRHLCAVLEEEERLQVLDGFFLGYCIPQIGKEFDLLKFPQEQCINIELKNHSTKDTIRRQLLRNQYYLRALDRELYLYTYTAQDDHLYTLKDDRTLSDGDWYELAALLRKASATADPNLLFRPQRYLISPVYTPQRFLSGEYFLTGHQEAIRNEILQSDARLFGIEGRSGTGKTLLLYDLYRNECMNGGSRMAAIIQCGGMHYGHEILLRSGIRIVPFEKAEALLQDVSVSTILVDEIQYLTAADIEHILAIVQDRKLRAVFAWDPLRSFGDREQEGVRRLQQEGSLVSYRLTAKIRSNKDTAAFTECLFDLSRRKAPLSCEHVHVVYSASKEESADTVRLYSSRGYDAVNGEDSRLQNFFEEEPEKAVFVLDDSCSYDASGRLCSTSPSCSIPTLQRRLGRVRTEICAVIENNPELFQALVELFS